MVTPKYYNDSHASEIDIVEEKDLYIEKYRRDHPIDTSEGILNSEEIDYVLENGVDAWKLQVDSPEIIDKVEVMDGLDVTFKDTAFPSSIISSAGASGNDSSSTSNNNNSNNKNEVYGVSILSNIQFPNEQLVYYYEVKIEEFNNQGSMSETSSTTTTTTTSQEEHVADIKKATTTTNIAIGVAMKPFVPLRMAGWVNYSAAFHTESGKVYGGSRHKILATAMTKSPPTNSAAHNHSSPGGVIVMPNDVIGIGWRPRSGKMFVTRNGEIIAKLKTPWARKRLYPVISTNGPAKISANFGSRGFVMANANIQCWGLAPPEGMGPPPPMYGCQDESILLAYTPLIHAAAAAAAASSSSCSASSSECGDQENEDQVGGGYHLRTNSDVSALTLFSNGAANSDAINGDQSILPPPDYGYHQPKSIDDNSSSSSPSTSMASSLLQVPAYSHGGGGGSGNRGGLVAASFKPGDSGDLLLLSPSLTRSRSDPRENAAAAAAATTYIETPNRDQIESDTQNNDDSAQVSSRPHPSQCSIVVATSV
ncbi:Protein ssh4 [Mycoemilia scoparia]|uniref:Protein ssh4 n=1 Tax=Mycoemilia scoparia TaxID=417184 RepID=A0A9W8DP29_9FUNG|nr:Protein ssh4 [Mycoemilia scoparia]